MIKEAIATGATVEEATANAKAQLAAPIDAEIKVEVIEREKKKVLGLFGGSPAKVKVSYDAPEEKKFASKPAKKAEKAFEPKAAQKPVAQAQETAEEEKAAPVEITKTQISADSKLSIQTAVNYLKEVVLGMGAEKADVEVFETSEGEIILELDCGEDYGIVIGRRGDTLDSIQYLTRLAAGRKKVEGDYTRISINVGNYREKRRRTLTELAKKNAAKVLKYGRNVTFEPMNPYERRIIHTAVQEIEGVTSHSVGTDDGRRVVITLAEGVKPTHPSRGGYNNRGRNNYNRGKGGRPNNNRSRNNGSRNNYNSRNNYASGNNAPQRAPKTDAGAAGVSLYGKIN